MLFFRSKRQTKDKIKSLTITKLQVVACLVIFFAGNSAFALTSQEINQRINDANSKLSQIRSDKQTLAGQVAEFDSQIYAVQLQIDAAQNEINTLNGKINQTNQQINKAELDLKRQQDLMRDYLRTMYIEGQVSTIELIVKSKNFSDFVDQSEYLGSIQEKVQDTANSIVVLQKDLAVKKKSLEVEKAKSEQLKMAQVLQQQAINNQRAVKDSLLQQTKGNEANYQALLNNLYQQRAALSARNNETIGGGGSSYPYAGSNPDAADPWGMYYRQCTSFAAWHSATFGPVSGSVISDWGHNHRANGGDWGWLASSHGYTVNSTPSVNAIMSFPYQAGMPYGHVAIVTSVNGNGTVNVAEYNYSYPLAYGTRGNVDPARYGAVFIH